MIMHEWTTLWRLQSFKCLSLSEQDNDHSTAESLQRSFNIVEQTVIFQPLVHEMVDLGIHETLGGDEGGVPGGRSRHATPKAAKGSKMTIQTV